MIMDFLPSANRTLATATILTIAGMLLSWSNQSIAFSKVDVTNCTVGAHKLGGAIASDIKDDTAAIQACLDAAGSEAAVYFPPGNYVISSTLIVTNNNVTLYSDTRSSAQLSFQGCGDLIRFARGTQQISNNGIKGLWLHGDGHCVQTGVHYRDQSWGSLEDVQIDGFVNGIAGSSIGLQVDGREGFNARNLRIIANLPIVIGRNPNHPYLDADHVHLENIYSTVEGPNWHVTLRDGVTVTNMTLDGANPLAGGCGILKWVTTTPPPSVSVHLVLAGIRHEQQYPGCDRQIDIELPASRPLQEFKVDNSRLEGPYTAGHNAIYLRSVDSISIVDTSYPNPASATTNANFINASGARAIYLANNYLTPFGGKIVTASPVLQWTSGPFGGKDCCDPPGVRTLDSGTLAK